MGFILISVIIFLVGVILLLLDRNSSSDSLGTLGTILAVFGAVLILIFGMIAGVVQSTAQSDMAKAQYKKQILEYRLETSGLDGNELLYSDIVKFNSELYTTKHYAHKFMTKWLFNSKVADNVDYISIGEVVFNDD